ncbi:MAG: hypothetical protein V3W44_08515 [Dehalococcoidales bacterium]
MAARRRRRQARQTLRELTKVEKFIGETQEEFGELGLTNVAFGASLANPEILAAVERVREAQEGGVAFEGGRLRRRTNRLARLLRTAEGQRFVSQAKAGKETIGEEEEDILGRLKGRKVRRTQAKRIQAGRAITRRTGGLGLLGQTATGG